jgi:hypothetical protein
LEARPSSICGHIDGHTCRLSFYQVAIAVHSHCVTNRVCVSCHSACEGWRVKAEGVRTLYTQPGCDGQHVVASTLFIEEDDLGVSASILDLPILRVTVLSVVVDLLMTVESVQG